MGMIPVGYLVGVTQKLINLNKLKLPHLVKCLKYLFEVFTAA